MSVTATLPGMPQVDAVGLSTFEAAWMEYQEATRRLWFATMTVWERTEPAAREFVPEELGLVMNCQPATAQTMLTEVGQAFDLGELLIEWSAGRLTDRHVRAAVEQLHASLTDESHRRLVLSRVLDRCRRRVAAGGEWPAPGEFKRLIRVAALLVDPAGAARRKKAASEQRGVHASALPHGQAMLALEGPEERVAVMVEAIRARAARAVREPGETRTRAQLEFDLAEQLLVTGTLDEHDEAREAATTGLTADAPGDVPDGAPSGVASGATGDRPAGTGPVRIDAQVVVPIDPATGDGEALGELPGLGPILPSTCRELLARASTLTRVCVDAMTGRVIAVDPPVRVEGDPAAIAETLAEMRTAPVMPPPPGSARYRPGPKTLRFIRTRDRTCRFPGCPRPACASDVDHELPWPLGPTHPDNLHCLCRRHHRAKQSGLFTVHTEPDGTTTWTLTATGAVYRRPPPEITPTL